MLQLISEERRESRFQRPVPDLRGIKTVEKIEKIMIGEIRGPPLLGLCREPVNLGVQEKLEQHGVDFLIAYAEF